jgi:phospholipid/cholesterol/gamma-HCH transport system substrate-binding protein
MNKVSGFTWKLGMFVIIGSILFVSTIYFIGKEKNLFGSTVRLRSLFKTVNGLKVGNNVRFSGINIGTVDAIELISDSSVMVELVIKKEIQKFIKKDAKASIGSDGLMGDKVLTITSLSDNSNSVKENEMIISRSPIEMEDIMNSIKESVDNAHIITSQLAQFSYKINNGDGALSKLISDKDFSNSLKSTLANLQNSSNEFAIFTTKMNDGKGALSKMVSDDKFGQSLDSTMSNLQAGTKSLRENMEAAKHNFLLRGYFKKKKRAKERIQEINTISNLKKAGSEESKDSVVIPIINPKDSIKK